MIAPSQRTTAGIRVKFMRNNGPADLIYTIRPVTSSILYSTKLNSYWA
uniref:Uncharacterized protein n=1 Tax=Picea sitchensis TaxID=3332 RepID=A0A6B9XXC8_PICSI|nr:hypothetical protein Q903MT_gene6747 [Picea sitchensis]